MGVLVVSTLRPIVLVITLAVCPAHASSILVLKPSSAGDAPSVVTIEPDEALSSIGMAGEAAVVNGTTAAVKRQSARDPLPLRGGIDVPTHEHGAELTEASGTLPTEDVMRVQ